MKRILCVFTSMLLAFCLGLSKNIMYDDNINIPIDSASKIYDMAMLRDSIDAICEKTESLPDSMQYDYRKGIFKRWFSDTLCFIKDKYEIWDDSLMLKITNSIEFEISDDDQSPNSAFANDIYDLLSFYDEITTEDKKLKLVVETEYHPSFGRSLYDAKTLIKTCQVITPSQIRFYNINDNQYVKGVDVYDLKKEFMKRYDISIKDFDKKIIEKKLVDTLSIKLADILNLYMDDI